MAAAAQRLGAFVRVDMEDHELTEPTLALVRDLRATTPDVGVVIQSYLRRSAADVERLIAEGTRVRLCKGAYDEPAELAFVTRAEVDGSYVALMERLLATGRYPALATHDLAIIRAAIAFARREGIGPERFEFQMLYGVRRDLQAQLVTRRLDGPRLRPVRDRVVSVLHAPHGGATGQPVVHPAQRAARGPLSAGVPAGPPRCRRAGRQSKAPATIIAWIPCAVSQVPCSRLESTTIVRSRPG